MPTIMAKRFFGVETLEDVLKELAVIAVLLVAELLMEVQ
jgi:hypothetical protein